MRDPFKIMIADDHELVRMGVRMLLEQMPDVQVVAEAESAEDAIRQCGFHQPDLVIMDIRMPPGTSGIDACREIVNRWPQMQVIMVTSFANDELISEAIRAGAVGYVLKQVGTGELVRAVNAVRRGEALLDPAVTRQVLAMMRHHGADKVDPFKDLTEREMDVLRQLAQGQSNAEIAQALVLSDKTVRNHVSIILNKLNLHNRVEAATYAIKHDILKDRS